MKDMPEFNYPKEIYNLSLLNELLEYSTNLKAVGVYYKCLKNKKFEIAKKIKAKYKIPEEYIDHLTAFGLSLIYKDGTTKICE